MQKKIIVSIKCLVYNHEPYLRQCLDGFVMQRTNFAFEAIVHDDCSTDGSATIIKEYAEKYPYIIKPILETENQYSKHDGSLTRVMNAAIAPTTKYIAYCEGDDYWTDPYKLQKQVDILESNPNVTMVYTGFHTVNQQGEVIIRQPYDSFSQYSHSGQLFVDLLEKNFIMTLTTCFRRECLFSDIIRHAPIQLDYNLFLGAAAMGDLFYIPDKTGCYRQNALSVMHTQSKEVAHSYNRIFQYYASLFFQSKIVVSSRYERFLINIIVVEKSLYEVLRYNNFSLIKENIRLKKYLIIYLLPIALYSIVFHSLKFLKKRIHKYGK